MPRWNREGSPGARAAARWLPAALVMAVLAGCGAAATGASPAVTDASPAPTRASPPAGGASPEPSATGPSGSGPTAGPGGPGSTGTPRGTPGATTVPPGEGLAPSGPTETATVLRVVDGDTIVVDRGRGAEKVRYIGVDTPETVHPSRPVEFMGREASAANRAMVEGRRVVLERDVSDTDRYGRLLRYVWVQDGQEPGGWLLVNLALVARGFAQVVTYPPDVRYVDRYLEAQRSAREQGAGLWGEDPGATAEAETGGDGDRCHAAYPGVCIPPPPPDLDCGDLDVRRFRVLPPDPHRFDGDGDGLGCE